MSVGNAMRDNHLLRTTSRTTARSRRKVLRPSVGNRRRRLAMIVCAIATGFSGLGDARGQSPRGFTMPVKGGSAGVRTNPFVPSQPTGLDASSRVVLASDSQPTGEHTSGLRLKSIGSAVGLVPIGAPRPAGMPIEVLSPAAKTIQTNPHVVSENAQPFVGPTPRAAVVIAPQPKILPETLPAAEPPTMDGSAKLQWAPVSESRAAEQPSQSSSRVQIVTTPELSSRTVEESASDKIDAFPLLPPLPDPNLALDEEASDDEGGFSFLLTDQVESDSSEMTLSEANADQGEFSAAPDGDSQTGPIAEEAVPDFEAIIAERRAAWRLKQEMEPEKRRRHRAAVAVVAAPVARLNQSQGESLVTSGFVRTAEMWKESTGPGRAESLDSVNALPVMETETVAPLSEVEESIDPTPTKAVVKPQELNLNAELGDVLTQQLAGKIVMVDSADNAVCSAVGEGSTELKIITRGIGEARVRVAYVTHESRSIQALEIALDVALPAAREASPSREHDAILKVLRKRYPRAVVEIEPRDRQLTVRGVCDSREEATEIIRLIRKSNLTPVEDRLVVR
ncbi:MAG: hypothetical protein AAGD07_20750 [Planctomycetota bacterium]